MSHQHPTRRRVASGAILATALIASALAFPAQATAYGCDNPKDLDCNLSGVTGGRPGGGGGGGTGGIGGPVEPPPPEGLTDNQAVDAVDGPPAPLAPAAPNTFVLVQQARDSAAFPVPRVHTAPEDKTYVRLRTTLWVDGFDLVQTQPITVGAQTVQATAQPSSVTWDLGEKKLVCEDAGSKGEKTCTYIYQRSSAGQPDGSYKITATINWKVSWTCRGADCDSAGGNLPDQTMTSQPTTLVVSEIQTNTNQ